MRTYKQAVIDDVRLADEKAMIINTSTQARPNLVREAYRLYKDIGAEAVFVISNKEATQNIVYGLESRGIPAFAPIFDS